MFIGVDGCKAGWLAIELIGDIDWKVTTYSNIVDLWNDNKKASLILIDIPIGLFEGGSEGRLCDSLARQALGWPRAASVFTAPCRQAVLTEDYSDANAINRKITGRGLPRQTWGIVPKIRETDGFLKDNLKARKVLREIHPEICFWALNGGVAMQSSKITPKGYLERKAVLKTIFPPTKSIIDETLNRYRRSELAKDDILDALAAALTAKLTEKNHLQAIPPKAQIDPKGFRMEMLYIAKNLNR